MSILFTCPATAHSLGGALIYNFMITIKCLVCGKKREVVQSVIFNNKGKFCSKKCYWKDMIGRPAIHPFKDGIESLRWKGGKYKSRGRWYILKPNHPFVNCSKYMRRSRLVAEKYLGRYLLKEEIIHHINGIKDDDNPENLYLFSSNSEHRKFEKSKNKPILISNLVS